jgi:alkylated DNA repair dioxygenase AlkB
MHLINTSKLNTVQRTEISLKYNLPYYALIVPFFTTGDKIIYNSDLDLDEQIKMISIFIPIVDKTTIILPFFGKDYDDMNKMLLSSFPDLEIIYIKDKTVSNEKKFLNGLLIVGDFYFLPGEKEELKNIPLIHHPPLKAMFGKPSFQRRDVQFFSDKAEWYEYASQKSMAKSLTPSLRSILNRINQYYNEDYNGILINRYADGTDYISAHSDDEKGLGKTSVVISLSIGSTRKFRIRDKFTKKIVLDKYINDGEILIMVGDFQKRYTHEIPKELLVKIPRTSLTFRIHKQGI